MFMKLLSERGCCALNINIKGDEEGKFTLIGKTGVRF